MKNIELKNDVVSAESVAINVPRATSLFAFDGPSSTTTPTNAAAATPSSTIDAPDEPELPATVWGIDRAIWNRARLLCFSAFYTMEYIGEAVVSALGLDESRYQYVIDGMDERDWEIAREVQARKDKAARQGDNAA